VNIYEVLGLLGHRYVTATQVYDKRRETAAESASHNLHF
jgi:hypothetical protein